MGADSQVTDGDQRIISPRTPKIIRKGKYLLGVTGDSRPGDILTHNWKPPMYKQQDPVNWMGRTVIPSIYNAFKDNGYDVSDKEASFTYLLSFDSWLFSIGCDLSFTTSNTGLYAAGSGGPYALGYLYSLKPSSYQSLLTAKVVAERAVKIASVLDINTFPPIQLETQQRGWEQ